MTNTPHPDCECVDCEKARYAGEFPSVILSTDELDIKIRSAIAEYRRTKDPNDNPNVFSEWSFIAGAGLMERLLNIQEFYKK